MKFRKALKHSFNMVIHSKLRSWLTILGIVIGVAAVISIVSLGDALEQSMTSQFDELGGDLVTLTAGAARAFSTGSGRSGGTTTSTSGAVEEGEEVELTRLDVQTLKGISDIKLLDTQIRGSAEIYYVAEKGTVTVTGVDPSVWFQMTTLKISDGRLLGPADSNVIVIGGNLATNYFDKNLGINQLVTIEEKLFRIIGVLDDTSNSVYMPISQTYDILDDKEEGIYDSIILQIKDEENLNLAIINIEQKLAITRHVTTETKDFSISSNQQTSDARSDMLNSLTTFLTAIAAVALLVSAVGIANTMFTSVLEKTKEIGIMKAIGARNNDILMIFLLNAGLIGLIGGVIGVLVGIILSGFLPAFLSSGGGILSRLGSSGTIINFGSILIALASSMSVGMFSGFIPAYQASRLKPVDALRYE